MDLIVLENNGVYTVDSREVAKMIDREHYNLLKDIRKYIDVLTEVKINVSGYFVESTYLDLTGRELPCYLCTKKGCDMIANKLTGKKGILFTAAYIEAFEKMRKFIEEGRKINNQIPFSELVKSIEIVADSLKVNDASKNLMYRKFYQSYGQPTDFLPYYELNESREMDCATNLIKENNFKVSTAEFNNEMRNQGYLEKRRRRGKSGKVKYFNSLTLDGLKFGENAINPHNQNETRPLYYKGTFRTLFFEIFGFPREADLQ